MLINHLKKSFNLTTDLIKNLSEDNLKLKLSNLPSNTIGAQLWCVIGARESYLKAIVNCKWSGFSCSLTDKTSKNEALLCLEKSTNDCISFLKNHSLSEKQGEFLMSLLEHEIQHHGQLIRYIYGNKLNFPKSWNERYTV